MANDISGRQLIIDTASATPLITWNVKISDANWFDMAAGATLTITDLHGRTFTYVAYQADYPVALGKLGWMNGLVCTVISSGKLYMVIDK